MRKELKAYVAAELRDYHDTIKALQELETELLEESAPRHEGRSSQIADPTGQRAVRLINNRRLAHMIQVIKAIEAVLARLQPEKHRLLTLLYWQKNRCYNHDGLALELEVDKSTVYRWLDGIYLAVAIELGMIDADDNITKRPVCKI